MRSCTVGLFVKCILEFSDMHIQTIQVMPNNVCQELHFNFKILMICKVVNIQVVMVMFKLLQRIQNKSYEVFTRNIVFQELKINFF